MYILLMKKPFTQITVTDLLYFFFNLFAAIIANYTNLQSSSKN